MDRDARRQAEYERIQEYARRIAAEAPPLTPEQLQKLRTLLGRAARTPARELMVWRLRLYCGHETETRVHKTGQPPHGAVCPVCGRDAMALQAVALGPPSEPEQV
jgi:hypothetical protein